MPTEERDFAKKIVADVTDDRSGNTVIIFIPSHDKKDKELKDEQQWASEALEMFARLFGGATGFTGLLGS